MRPARGLGIEQLTVVVAGLMNVAIAEVVRGDDMRVKSVGHRPVEEVGILLQVWRVHR